LATHLYRTSANPKKNFIFSVMRPQTTTHGSNFQTDFPPQTALGLCLGASTISVVAIENPGRAPSGRTSRIVYHNSYAHEGNPRQTLIKALAAIDPHGYHRIAVTGRRFRHLIHLSSLAEPSAVEYAYAHVKPAGIDCPAVVSAGGETFMVYVLDRQGRIANVLTGNKCASGTGEFFLQQLRRMNVTLEQAALWSERETPYPVSGRCSVFCKSDCTHATNKGVPKAQVTAGLCRMMAEKIIELLKKVDKNHVMLVGATARNRMMVHHLRQQMPSLIVPEEAPYFEALGAALWALDHQTLPFPGVDRLFTASGSSFDRLPALDGFESMVTFKQMARGRIRSGDTCILGLDVGSTTTKAVLMRRDDDSLLASVYLRTNGDPVGASRQCYAAIAEQVRAAADPATVHVVGLGVCGSGRQIAGLHALTDAVINEIIAHCTAAVHFDPQVDTVFEIGGQDAKYTHITASVPSDYAMNEACSAGTGSFLEESALETLGIAMEQIAAIALQGRNPPNFNDQCAAFIASDIKNAIHEGIAHADIVAGLVYSICMNYTNRVKGNRPVGEKIFMQGGVCYNRAVPLAMAALCGKPIVVPPEPGLMGAYGVALEVKKRQAAGLLAEKAFDLQQLAQRQVAYGRRFICKGGKEKCDRRCPITLIQVQGGQYPFGGACNRYTNLRRRLRVDTAGLDGVSRRQKIVFGTAAPELAPIPDWPPKRRIGLNRSFLVNTYFPLYATFFKAIGLDVVLAQTPSRLGIDRRGAAFCYPAELAHGFFHSLLEWHQSLDFIFLPHFKAVPMAPGQQRSQVCPFVQGETYYLRTTFHRELEILKNRGTRLLSPVIDLTEGLDKASGPLIETARQIGVPARDARAAVEAALAAQRACFDRMQAQGRALLAELEADPSRIAAVICGRPYSAFVQEAHMGIPRKLASRGVTVLPLDFLALAAEKAKRRMYWGMGQSILQAARLVARHPQLFGLYITNFSCGPDSFLIGYFRDIMGSKPSLTLELDSHTADAGLETRIEAFLDIVAAYRQLTAARAVSSCRPRFVPARTVMDNGTPKVVTSAGQSLPMTDPRVTLLFPSMGEWSSQALAAAFRSRGFNAVAHPPADEAVLKIGRAHTSCKECLPLILTTGTLLQYARKHQTDGQVLVYFMATGSGPCRFGQYAVFMEDLVKKLALPDVALFSISSDNGYAGFDSHFHQRCWWAVVVSDVIEDIRSMLLANATDPPAAAAQLVHQWQNVLNVLENGDFDALASVLRAVAAVLRKIPLKRPVDQVPVIALVGEIFVRRDAISRQYITEKLAAMGFATICAPVAEWIHYADHLVDQGLGNIQAANWRQRLSHKFKSHYMRRTEARIKTILAQSGLVHSPPVDIKKILAHAAPYVQIHHTGEAILTVGSALAEVITPACGVIAIGPFGCMPNRMSEAILSEIMTAAAKSIASPGNRRLKQIAADVDALPFLAIESDGSPFPQVINARIEAFCLQAERLHALLRAMA
jgi:predicted CoA-substrate-specific enzyme activase